MTRLLLAPVMIIAFALSIISCKNCNKNVTDIEHHETINAEKSMTDRANLLVTDTITYDVKIKDPNPSDYFVEECLKNFDRPEFIDMIFDLVYEGKLSAYDIVTNEAKSIEDIKAMEAEEGWERKNIGKIQFEESWEFNKKEFTFNKHVRWIRLGYEKKNPDGSVRGYSPVFSVLLN